MTNPRAALLLNFLYVVGSLVSLLPLATYVAMFSPSPPPSSSITVGSSLSPSLLQNSYLLSPSGIFSFGFYPWCSQGEQGCGQYKVGIWLNKPSEKILVWSAQFWEDGASTDKKSSLLLDHDGVFLLRRPGIPDMKLFYNLSQPAYSATMQDNGNFVIYNSDSDIIWQSFDYPTDTILSGQTLKSDNRLLSNTYRLPFYDGKLVLQNEYNRIWESEKYKEGSPIALNLDSTGRLYLVDKNGIITKNLTEGEEQSTDSNKIYRVTLGPDGYFRLYAENLGGESVELWRSFCSTCQPSALYGYFGTYAEALGSSGGGKTVELWRSYVSTCPPVALFVSGITVLIAMLLRGVGFRVACSSGKAWGWLIVVAAIMVMMCAAATYINEPVRLSKLYQKFALSV